VVQRGEVRAAVIVEGLDFGLLIKLGATAVLVLSATVLAERFGAFVGAIIASMPLSAGPAYLFLALEHGTAFIARSSLTSLAVHAMTPVLLVVCANLVRRTGIVVALGVALLVWFVGAILVMRAELTLAAAVLLNVVVFAVMVPASWPLRLEVRAVRAKRGVVDVVLRVLAVAGIVGAAVVAGRVFGPKAAGLMALVPVIWISVAVILAVRAGPEMCQSVLANGVPAMIGFAIAFSVMHLTVARVGWPVALSVALWITVGWNLLLTAVRPMLRRPRPAGG
jgi:hypothetical protein